MKKILLTLLVLFSLKAAETSAMELSEISFKDKEADWIEISLNGGEINPITIKEDTELISLLPEQIANKKFILIHFKSEVEKFENEPEILHVYLTKDGLVGTTEQIILETNSEIIDLACWQNSNPAKSEQKDLEDLKNLGVIIPTCLDSDAVKNGQFIGKINGEWQILTQPTPGQTNYIKDNENPSAVITIQKGELTDEVPFSLNLDGSLSTDPENGTLSYNWEYPDKSIEGTKNPPSYRFEKPGNFEISLTVTDEEGISDTQTIEITALGKNSNSNNPNSSSNGDLSNAITINEVHPNPEGQDSKKEWLELYNSSNQDVNLNNWKINKTKIKDQTIAANSYLIINLALKNTANTLILTDFEGKTIDELNYSDAIEGQSFAKISIKKENSESSDWIWTPPSKNLQNPTLYAISGTITTPPQIASDFFFEIANNNKTLKILINEQTHDFNFLQNLLKEGQAINLLLSKQNQEFLLIDYKIDESQSPPPATTLSQNLTSIKWIYYLSIPLILIAILFILSNRAPQSSPNPASPHKSKPPRQLSSYYKEGRTSQYQPLTHYHEQKQHKEPPNHLSSHQ